MGRRLSEAVAPQPEAGGAKSPLERKFADLVKRLMNEDGLDLEAAQAMVREWIEENVSTLDLQEQAKLYEEFFSGVMPPFLLGHVKKAKRAMVWDALLTTAMGLCALCARWTRLSEKMREAAI